MSQITPYHPPGPVAARFLASNAPVRCIMGPIGSGKTGACLMDILYRAYAQQPSPIDGVAYSKFAVIRDTYRNLHKTTIPSWHSWVSRDFGEFVSGGANGPSHHRLRFERIVGGRRQKVDVLVEFIALGDHSIEDVMRGWEGTGAYINEADRLRREALIFLRGRVGRYPSMRHGGPTWRGVWLDCNAPDTENWIYEDFVENPIEGAEFFVQPSGFSRDAENLHNLPPGYYEEQSKGAPHWYVHRMIENKFGYSREGKPVYPEWNDQVHAAGEDLQPAKGLPLVLGADAGLTPGLVVCQRMPDGQWRILDEITEEGGATKFGELLNRLLGSEKYRDCRVGAAWADPAGASRASTDERSWIDVLSAVTGVRFRPAPSNRPLIRLEAVRVPLTRLIDGRPGLLLSPSCKVLRKGFNSGYRYRRMAGPDGRFTEEPEKNAYSHVHDALQYALLGGGEYVSVTSRVGQHRQALAVQEAVGASDYDPLRW